MANRQGSKTCFVAMPISTRAAEFELFRDQDHWGNVFTYLIAPAVEAAGYTVVAPGREGSEHITKAIVTQVSTADIMLCDLSLGNANVFFEFGLRTSLNLPVAVIHDAGSPDLPFDVHAINAYRYRFEVPSIVEHREAIARHLLASERTSGGTNPLWEAYGAGFTTARDAEVVNLRDQLVTLRDERDGAIAASLADADLERAITEFQKERSGLKRSVTKLTKDRNDLRARLMDAQAATITPASQEKITATLTRVSDLVAENRALTDQVKLLNQRVANLNKEKWWKAAGKWIGGLVLAACTLALFWTIGHWPMRWIHINPSQLLHRHPGVWGQMFVDGFAGLSLLVIPVRLLLDDGFEWSSIGWAVGIFAVALGIAFFTG